MEKDQKKRELWTDDEWVITLGYYFFDKQVALKTSNLKRFTDKLNSYTGKKRSTASIELRICNYRSIDPEFEGKGMANGGKSLIEYWDKYIVKDASHFLLAERYSNFINIALNCPNKIVAIQETDAPAKSFVSSVVTFYRSPTIKKLTLERAHGVCDLCGTPAPFETFEGTPYLEVHHILSLSEGGSDNCKNTIALCPNCHRKIHYANLSIEERKTLNDHIRKISYI